MKYILFLSLTLFLGVNTYAQTTVRMDAVKGNEYGVAYKLPKTALEVKAEYTKTTRIAGEFYMYAERYLNIADPIVESQVEYKLDRLDVTPIGVPDVRSSFLVEFRPNSAAAYVTLTQDGLICAINDIYTFPKSQETTSTKTAIKEVTNAHQYFSEEILRAGSSAKQAELIAKQIYRLRETKNDILTGEADNMPPDGAAYKLVMQQLDDQELALTSLFIGTENTETMSKTMKVDLTNKDINESVVARFSHKLGLVEANNLAGEAIYLSLKAKNPRPALLLSIKETKDREKKFSKGIVYNIPGKASLEVEYKGKYLVNKDIDVVQFGDQDVLDQKPFGDKNNPLKVVFYPEMGAIKQTGGAR